MAESTAPDPAELWREMLTQWERSVNDMSSKVMTSGEFSSSANQLGAVVMRVQETLGELLDRYFRALNLPTRKDVERLDERMMAIEDLLHSMGAALERMAPPRAAVDDDATGEEYSEHVARATNAVEPVISYDNGHVVGSAAIEDVPAFESAAVAKKIKRAPAASEKTVKRPPRTKRPPSKKSPAA